MSGVSFERPSEAEEVESFDGDDDARLQWPSPLKMWFFGGDDVPMILSG